MIERPSVNERAVLVQLDFGADDLPAQLAEVRLLAQSAGALVCSEVYGARRSPDPASYAGKGKVQEILSAMSTHSAELVIFNHELSPAQERNLERILQCRVVDRTRLILDIFAQRAHSAEGQLQVELAQLEHLATRLVRGWTHLERQKGGIGLRGPGETQLETDRRLLGKRVKLLKERLLKLERQRGIQGKSRRRSEVLNVALVGYTNAGKSSLFNALTHANVHAADQLFATLDTTSRKLWLGAVGNIVISDTVGFIRDLPHTLVAAFHATLESSIQADLLLHVIDSASTAREQQIADVNKVLLEIGAGSITQIEVFNKIDLNESPAAQSSETLHIQSKLNELPELPAASERDPCARIRRVYVSAKNGTGLAFLRDALTEAALEKRACSRTQTISDHAANPTHNASDSNLGLFP
ncbi:MAG: GTPase HflX [Pseudomonadota bacterium]